jgi:hypothetical protein
MAVVSTRVSTFRAGCLTMSLDGKPTSVGAAAVPDATPRRELTLCLQIAVIRRESCGHLGEQRSSSSRDTPR